MDYFVILRLMILLSKGEIKFIKKNFNIRGQEIYNQI